MKILLPFLLLLFLTTYSVIAEREGVVDLSSGSILLPPSVENIPFEVAKHNVRKFMAGNAIPPPVVNIYSAPNTSCGYPNGYLEAFIEGANMEDYQFSWFNAMDNTPLPGPQGPIVFDLREGHYRLSVYDVVNNTNLTEITATINFEPEHLILTPEFVTPVTSCEMPNGAAGVIIEYVINPADYSFSWYRNGFPDEIIGTEQQIASLTAGNYFVVVTNLISACSMILEVSIPDATPTFSVEVLQTSPVTHCLAPNGHIEARLREGGEIPVSENLELRWFAGEVADPLKEIISLKGSTSANGLGKGFYTLLAGDNNTGCLSEPVTVEITENFVLPEVTATSVPSASCISDQPDGSMTADVSTGVLAELDFYWYAGDAIKAVADFTGESVSNVAPGIYTLVAKNNLSGCSSLPVRVEIAQDNLVPSVEITEVNHLTSCGSSNGSARAVIISGDADLHSFKWYNGPNAEGEIMATGPDLIQLSAGTYSVVAVNEAGCALSPVAVQVEDHREAPVAEEIFHSDITHCNSPNGAISIQILLNGQEMTAPATIKWYSGPAADPAKELIAFADRRELTGLEAGVYTAVVVNAETACTSLAQSFTLLDATVSPEPAIVSTANTSCAAGASNGSLSFSVGGQTAGYTFKLYSLTAMEEKDLLGSGEKIENLPAGEYTLLTINEISGCSVQTGVSVSAEPHFPGAPSVAGAESCGPAELSLSVSGAGEYKWYETETGGSPVHTGNTLRNTFTSTAHFYVSAVNEAGCESPKRTLVTAIINALPEVVIQAEGNLLMVPEAEGHTYRWFLNDELLSHSQNQTEAAETGTYQVEIMNENGCSLLSEPYLFTISGVENKNLATEAKVFPNPFQDRIRLEIPSELPAPVSIRIFNGQQKVIKDFGVQNISSGHLLQVSDLIPGVYILELSTGSKRAAYKIMKLQ